MPRLKLTDAAVSRMKAPPKPAQIDHWDMLTPAFGLRISYSGAKTWITQVRILENGKWNQTRVTIGRYPVVSLAEARERAREIQRIASTGEDPRRLLSAPKRELEENSRKTFASVRDRFIKQYCRLNLKEKTANEYQRVLSAAEFKDWESRPITSITRQEVIALLDSIVEAGTPIKANRVLAYLRAMMNWAVSRDLLSSAPTDRVEPPVDETKRDRALTNNEVAILWKIFDAQGVFGPLLKLLLLTGQRREEVAQMQWSELRDLDGDAPIWEIPKERVKMDRPHLVPLSPLAVEVIQSTPRLSDELVFTTNGKTSVSGFSRLKTRLDAAILKIKKEQKLTGAFEAEWIIHDLRRTAATHMAELGVSRDVVELILNHRSGTRGGVAGIYNRSELLTERRRALCLWAEHIRSLSAPQKKAEPLILKRDRDNHSTRPKANLLNQKYGDA